MPRNWRKQLELQRQRPTPEVVAALTKLVGDEGVSENESLARHTTYRIGGPADLFVVVEDTETLAKVLPLLDEHELPLTILGGGSNVLVQDGGIRGVVLKLGRGFAHLDVNEEDDRDVVSIGAATTIGYLIKEGRNRGWKRLAPVAGTPGTIGGALRMNAGDRHTWLGDFVEEVHLLNRDGSSQSIAKEKAGYGYRTSRFPARSVIVGGTLAFQRGDRDKVREEIDAHISRRKETQPLNQPSGGSVFRNPEGAHAGELIERVGLKGVRLHDVQFSEKHANFIVNLGEGRARDVLALIRTAKQKVYDETGIRLEEELRIIGEAQEDEEDL